MPCLPASALTPCLLALVCICPIPSITMCARIITQVAGLPYRQPHRPLCLLASVPIQYSAGTALQAATPRDCIEQPVHRVFHPYIHPLIFLCLRQYHPLFCRDCPVGSRTRGLHWCSPCTILCSLRSFQGGGLGLHWAAGHIPCSNLHLFHEPETAFGQPGSLLQEWPVGWRIAAGLG